MTDYTNLAGGAADGATVTTSNSGGAAGSPFAALYGTAPTFATVASRARYAIQAGATATAIVEWTSLSAAVGSGSLRDRFGIRITALPAATTKIAELRSESGAAVHVYLTSAGKLQVNDVTANGNSTVTKVFSNAIAVNTDYEVAVTAIPGSSTSNGTISFGYYLSSAPTSPVETVYTSSALNTGTAVLTRTRHGKITATAWTDTFYIWNLESTDAGTGLLGPINRPPVVSAGADSTVALGSSITLVGTATDPDGTIASTAWTCTSYPGSTAPTIASASSLSTTSTGPTAGVYQFRLTATDNLGATVFDTRQVTVTSVTAPTATATVTTDWAVIDATGSTPGTGGDTLSYTVTPSTGVITLPTAGKFLVPRGLTAQQITVTVTESGSGATGVFTATVPAKTAAYSGSPITLTLATPLDLATTNQWGSILNQDFQSIEDVINALITYFGA